MTRKEDRVSDPRPGRARSLSRHPIVIASVVALAILLAYQEVSDRPAAQRPLGASDTSDRNVAERRSPSPDWEDTLDDTPAEPVFPPSQDAPLPDPVRAADLIAELTQKQPEGTGFVWSEIEAINSRLDDLKEMGEAALPAIRDYLLASNPDPRLSDVNEHNPADPMSLRIVLLEALTQIPGQEALDLMAQLVGMTSDPQEIDLLAKGLEQRAPGTYRSQIASSARAALGTALQSDPGAFRNVGYLFAVLQDYGDASIAADLGAVAQEGSAWGDHALMLLAKLPEGYGVGALIRAADGLAVGKTPTGPRYGIALQMLGQASRAYPEAGDALLQLAREGKIGTPALIELAATLGGSERELVSRSFGLFARSRPLTSALADAPKTWSEAEIAQRLELIDRLLGTRPDPAAVTA
ncbi:MAG: hypothetical protein ACREA0_04880, partial [bacterium]